MLPSLYHLRPLLQSFCCCVNKYRVSSWDVFRSFYPSFIFHFLSTFAAKNFTSLSFASSHQPLLIHFTFSFLSFLFFFFLHFFSFRFFRTCHLSSGSSKVLGSFPKLFALGVLRSPPWLVLFFYQNSPQPFPLHKSSSAASSSSSMGRRLGDFGNGFFRSCFALPDFPAHESAVQRQPRHPGIGCKRSVHVPRPAHRCAVSSLSEVKKKLSPLTCLGGTASTGSVSRRISEKKSSPYGPYFFVSFNS